ncbi:MAG: 3-deoxy-D-manno-octulosonic acid transferase [Rhodospirillales bacterium]|nr:3-deoxy-D-manno-octulosonic acid transferase [Rhodospirillales bacterium]
MLKLYSAFTRISAPLLRRILKKRCRLGKEDPARLSERMGISSKLRPAGSLIWLHAASVGEAQSALIVIDALLKQAPDKHILVTTGTRTSADLMAKRLPPAAFHQYYPLDHPQWVEAFLDHWQPDLALWLESELWPNMLLTLQKRHIPAILLNARLSDRSQKRWKLAAGEIRKLLDSFALIIAQSVPDKEAFEKLGAQHVFTAGNLKYSAAPLPCNPQELKAFSKTLEGRPLWLYASTHRGEEELACRLHRHACKKIPDLLTIVVPRHPERRDEIKKICEENSINYCLKSDNNQKITDKTSVYIVDTMGDLGLFYRLAPLVCIGRSFSMDGGGGHNPIEAAQLDCAVLHGPRVQNLQIIYDEMDKAGAALRLKDETDFHTRLEKLLHDEEGLAALQNKAARFAHDKATVLEKIMQKLAPYLAAPPVESKADGQKCA